MAPAAATAGRLWNEVTARAAHAAKSAAATARAERPRGLRSGRLADQPISLDFPMQVSPIHPEAPRRLGHVPLALLQHRVDRVALGLVASRLDLAPRLFVGVGRERFLDLSDSHRFSFG